MDSVSFLFLYKVKGKYLDEEITGIASRDTISLEKKMKKDVDSMEGESRRDKTR